MLTGARRGDPGGIAKPDVDRVLVPDRGAQDLAAAHLASHGVELRLWINDDGTRPQLRADRLIGLQRALFLLRASFLDVLYVHRRSDVHPDDLALLAAEVAECGATLLVAGERISSPAEVEARADMAELATFGARLRSKASGRTGETFSSHLDDDELDIGVIDSYADAARLAHKLSNELRTPPELIAQLLDEARYECAGKKWTRRSVYELLQAASAHASVVTRDVAWGIGQPAMRVDLAYVPGGFDQQMPAMFQVLTEQGPEPYAALRFLLSLLRLGVIGAVVVPDPEILQPAVVGAVLLGEVRAAGAQLLVAGEVAPALDESKPLEMSAAVAARLHRALRHHDSCTVTTDVHALAGSELISWQEAGRNENSRAAKKTERERAQYLNKLAIPTTSGTGAWSVSAVRRFRA